MIIALFCIVAGFLSPFSPPAFGQEADPKSKENIDAQLLLLKDADAAKRKAAAEMLGKLQVVATAPQLVQALKDNDEGVRNAAVAALVNIGDKAIEALIAGIKDPDVTAADGAASALVKLGAPAIPALGKALAAKDPVLHGRASRALITIGIPAIPELGNGLRGTDAAVRQRTALALSAIGPAATAELGKSMADGNADVRAQAAWALGVIGPEASAAAREGPHPGRQSCAGRQSARPDRKTQRARFRQAARLQ
ncbi:MAG: HEAT repeat domain-containing protein [Planctomycetes bacterium]|nr:HEAT repeat domain-containing protein [Planctomycetota bacterium]